MPVAMHACASGGSIVRVAWLSCAGHAGVLDMLGHGATASTPGAALRVPPLRARTLPGAMAATERRFKVWRVASHRAIRHRRSSRVSAPAGYCCALWLRTGRFGLSGAGSTHPRTPPPPPPVEVSAFHRVRRETHCEFCDRRLPDWKATLTPTCGADAPAVMNVNFDGRTYRCSRSSMAGGQICQRYFRGSGDVRHLPERHYSPLDPHHFRAC